MALDLRAAEVAHGPGTVLLLNTMRRLHARQRELIPSRPPFDVRWTAAVSLGASSCSATATPRPTCRCPRSRPYRRARRPPPRASTAAHRVVLLADAALRDRGAPRRGRPRSARHRAGCRDLGSSAPARLLGAGRQRLPRRAGRGADATRRRAAADDRPDGGRDLATRRLPPAGAARQGLPAPPWRAADGLPAHGEPTRPRRCGSRPRPARSRPAPERRRVALFVAGGCVRGSPVTSTAPSGSCGSGSLRSRAACSRSRAACSRSCAARSRSPCRLFAVHLRVDGRAGPVGPPVRRCRSAPRYRRGGHVRPPRGRARLPWRRAPRRFRRAGPRCDRAARRYAARVGRVAPFLGAAPARPAAVLIVSHVLDGRAIVVGHVIAISRALVTVGRRLVAIRSGLIGVEPSSSRSDPVWSSSAAV